MKASDTISSNNSFLHNFKGYGGIPSQCQVDLMSLPDGKALVLFTDIDNGTSVTNMSAHLATEMVVLLKLDPHETMFAERYYPGSAEETMEQIYYKWDGKKFSLPEWRPLPESHRAIVRESLD
ncbi:MAG: hypothetical protein IM613_17430 [Cytophagales bacterium]|nr:hypothetical protein [Cytophagales bacterium]